MTRHFYDRDVVPHVWRDARAAHTAALPVDATSEEVAAALDGMLEELGASHTGHYTPDELAYYELADIFARGDLGQRLRALFMTAASPTRVSAWCRAGWRGGRFWLRSIMVARRTTPA